jgi:hypothetical protein
MTWLFGLRVKSKTGGLVAYTMDPRCIHIWSYRANLVVIILVFLYFEIFTARHTQPTSLCWRGHHRVGGNNDAKRRLTCSPKSTAEILCNRVNPVRVITTLPNLGQMIFQNHPTNLVRSIFHDLCQAAHPHRKGEDQPWLSRYWLFD